MESQNHVHVNDVFNLHHEVVVKRHLERMTLPEEDYADFGENLIIIHTTCCDMNILIYRTALRSGG